MRVFIDSVINCFFIVCWLIVLFASFYALVLCSLFPMSLHLLVLFYLRIYSLSAFARRVIEKGICQSALLLLIYSLLEWLVHTTEYRRLYY